MTPVISAPEALAPGHDFADFDCGEPELNDWLKRRALANQASGASRTFVVTDGGRRVLGFYALAAGAVTHQDATGSVLRNMPEPVPVLVVARLAVDVSVQGAKIGAALLQDAVRRSAMVAQHTGVRALLVHALNEPAKQFYERYGFRASPTHAMTLMMRVTALNE